LQASYENLVLIPGYFFHTNIFSIQIFSPEKYFLQKNIYPEKYFLCIFFQFKRAYASLSLPHGLRIQRTVFISPIKIFMLFVSFTANDF